MLQPPSQPRILVSSPHSRYPLQYCVTVYPSASNSCSGTSSFNKTLGTCVRDHYCTLSKITSRHCVPILSSKPCTMEDPFATHVSFCATMQYRGCCDRQKKAQSLQGRFLVNKTMSLHILNNIDAIDVTINCIDNTKCS